MPDLRNLALWALLGVSVTLGLLLLSSYGAIEVADSRRGKAEADLRAEEEAHNRTRDALAAQKREADQLLRSINATVLAQQNALDGARAAAVEQARSDRKVVDGLRADLLALRRTVGLQRQQALAAAGRGDGVAAEQGGPGAAAGAGGGHSAAAGGLFPAATAGAGDVEVAEDDDAYDADRINLAYAVCRADAIALRKALAPP